VDPALTPHRSRFSPWRTLALVVALGAVYATFARLALHAFPFSGDEYSYYLQAELFARGVLHAPTPAHPELLRVDHVLLSPWVCSKYPPGTSALLALGVRLGVPWLVTPLEGVVALLAMRAAARRLLGDRDAFVAVAVLGGAPLFAFQAATFYSHIAAVMWLAIAFALAVPWTSEGGVWRMVVAGAAIGCAFVTRPLDAVLFGLALLSLRAWRPVALAAAGALPFVALLLAYQAAQFGSPFTDGYAAYQPEFTAIYGASTARPAFSPFNAVDPPQIWHHLDILRSFLVDWTVPATALLSLLGWAALRDDARVAGARKIAVGVVAIFAVTLWVTIGDTDDGARPRYLTTTLLGLAWLAAPGWRRACEFAVSSVGRRAARVVGVVLWALPVVQLGAFVVERTPQIWVREGLAEGVARAGVDRGVVVVRAKYPTRYARNGPFFDRPVLYVSAPPTASAEEVAAAFPGRDVYEAHEAPLGTQDGWQIDRVAR
jgi:4-amino-4-deoxy-L-arabinose transferase-like glycosyltransferase